MSETGSGRSWSGTVDYGPGPLHAPASLPQLQALVGRSRRIRALGTRHSFSEVAASDADLVTLAQMPQDIDVDTTAGTVRVGAGVRYGELAPILHAHGLALRTMGSLPHISVGGASATGTHGSGDAHRVLAAGVRRIEMVGADGDLLWLDREQDAEEFGGAVLALGCLGIATHLTLDLVPAHDMRQAVYLDVPADEVGADGIDALLAAGTSVSLFHHVDGTIAQVWVKQAVAEAGADGDPDDDRTECDAGLRGIQRTRGGELIPSDPASPFPPTLRGARRAEQPVHPAPGQRAHHCTDQSDRPGPWFERLPHFRLEFTPSSGAEIQSEYLVARADAAAALDALTALGERVRPLLQVAELRSIAADDLWLSPAHGRDSVGLHFTWHDDPAGVQAILPEVEAALAPFSPRPHWGKVFTMAPRAVQAQYPRLEDFHRLRDRLDPQRVFANDFTDRLLCR